MTSPIRNLTAYPTPRSQYQKLIESGALRRDDYQEQIIDKLQALHEQLENYERAPTPETEPSASLVRVILFFSAKIRRLKDNDSRSPAYYQYPMRKQRNMGKTMFPKASTFTET